MQVKRRCSWRADHRAMNTPCKVSAKINICDDDEVHRLCVVLNCCPGDLYRAVAYVGDRLCCVRAHIEKNVPSPAGSRGARVQLGSLGIAVRRIAAD